MQTRVAVMSIIVENPAAVEPLNSLLHSHSQHIIGRMGLPYGKRTSASFPLRWMPPKIPLPRWQERWDLCRGSALKPPIPV